MYCFRKLIPLEQWAPIVFGYSEKRHALGSPQNVLSDHAVSSTLFLTVKDFTSYQPCSLIDLGSYKVETKILQGFLDLGSYSEEMKILQGFLDLGSYSEEMNILQGFLDLGSYKEEIII